MVCFHACRCCFVEYIFGWNGLGKEIVEALNNLDLPVIMGSVLVISTTFVVINILVDIIYAYLDQTIIIPKMTILILFSSKINNEILL
jgi:ABC-type dipeptide/oligopeptide/nickel transport system permease component